MGLGPILRLLLPDSLFWLVGSSQDVKGMALPLVLLRFLRRICPPLLTAFLYERRHGTLL